jgi:hypothetical protein
VKKVSELIFFSKLLSVDREVVSNNSSKFIEKNQTGIRKPLVKSKKEGIK